MKLLTVVGARPQFIKAAMFSRVIRSRCTEILVHTGQHYDKNMSGYFFDQLRIPEPDYHLGIKAKHQGEQTARMIIHLERILLSEKPDMVLVYGDTNSTLAGSLAAAKLHIPVAHVEAGLRSYNKTMPEEINRIMTDHLATLLFCPTLNAVKNLVREGMVDHLHLVGDIMYDAVLEHRELARQQSPLSKWRLSPQKYILATVHRAENTDDPGRLANIFQALSELDDPVLLPLHPRTKQRLNEWQLKHCLRSPNITVIEPVHYFDMLVLQSEAKMILTDSGGMQKEAYMLQTPCITMRDETEWIETVEAGWNHLVGADKERIIQTARHIKTPDKAPPLFGDGKTAQKIADIIFRFLK